MYAVELNDPKVYEHIAEKSLISYKYDMGQESKLVRVVRLPWKKCLTSYLALPLLGKKVNFFFLLRAINSITLTTSKH